MPAKRLSMRKIKEVLRLSWAQSLSKRQTARSCGISRPAVDEYLRRAEQAGLSWPLPDDLDDGALERVLFPPRPGAAGRRAGRAGLGHGQPGAQAQGRHPVPVVAGVSGKPSERLPVQLVLRPLPGNGAAAGTW